MKNNNLIIPVLLLFVILSSCSPRILGVWTVENFETVTQGVEGVSAKNIGTITFFKDGTGTKDLSFTIFGMSKEDKTPFTWTLNDNLLTINGQDSDFAKTWIIVDNQKKVQKMKSTDGADQVQILDLKK